MKTHSLISAAAFCLALGACNASSTNPPFEHPLIQRQTISVARWTAPHRPDRRTTWFSPELAKANTAALFVSDPGTSDVYIYNLQTLKLIGTVTGLNQPQGECADMSGDVWVTDANAAKIYELSHQGRLEKQLNDSSGEPVGCAWDPGTGDLAVMNLFGEASSSGNILIFPKGGKTPRTITNTAQYNYDFGGYDAGGNLFFDGRDPRGHFMLSELSKGATSATTIALSGGSIGFPGMVQWDGSKHQLIVGDQSCANAYASCLYTVKVSGNRGTVTGKVGLKDSSGAQVCDLVQGVEYNGRIAGSDFDFCGSGSSSTDLWPYPAGGAPTLSNAKTDATPVGAAVSVPAHANTHSWMRAGTTTRNLLYVADFDNEVTVYDYKSRKLVGILTGFSRPMGECADAAGDVYITDSSAKQIVEYAHGGTQPIETLSDAPDTPYTCSVDPTTGDLAVANDNGTKKEGNIAIWTRGSGTPVTYTDSKLFSLAGCAYDSTGALLVTNGSGYSTSGSFAWLPPGGKKLIDINIPGPSSGWKWYVSGILWDGKFFVLDDDDLYRISLIHGQAYYIGETPITNSYSGHTAGQFWIYNHGPNSQGTQVVGSHDEESYFSVVEFWRYPSGGKPFAATRHGVDQPFGVTISLATPSR